MRHAIQNESTTERFVWAALSTVQMWMWSLGLIHSLLVWKGLYTAKNGDFLLLKT